MEEIRRAFGGVFLRDVRTVEPSKKGWVVGENLRIYDEGGGYVLSFLRGTDEGQRRQARSKLEGAGISYTVGEDFST